MFAANATARAAKEAIRTGKPVSMEIQGVPEVVFVVSVGWLQEMADKMGVELSFNHTRLPGHVMKRGR